jgi:hypothetical protein
MATNADTNRRNPSCVRSDVISAYNKKGPK